MLTHMNPVSQNQVCEFNSVSPSTTQKQDNCPLATFLTKELKSNILTAVLAKTFVVDGSDRACFRCVVKPVLPPFLKEIHDRTGYR